MNETISIELYLKPQTVVIYPAEVALLESILPEIIKAMMQAEDQSEAE